MVSSISLVRPVYRVRKLVPVWTLMSESEIYAKALEFYKEHGGSVHPEVHAFVSNGLHITTRVR